MTDTWARYLRRARIAAMSISLISSTGLMAPPPAFAATNPDLTWVEGELGSSVTSGGQLSFPTFSVTGSIQGVAVSAPDDSANHSALVALTAPLGGSLVAHTAYEQALRQPTVAQAGLGVTVNGTGCNTSLGNFVIDDITFDQASGVVTSLVARWEIRCDGSDATAFGGVSWNSSVPVARHLLPVSVPFGSAPFGSTSAPATVSIQNLGSGPLTIGAVRIVGRDASSFAVVSDACTGSALASGGSCPVSITFHPEVMDGALADLEVFDSSLPGPSRGLRVRLTGVGAPGVSSMTVEGEADNGLGAMHLTFTDVSVTTNGFGGVHVTGGLGAEQYIVSFTTPTAAALTVGSYSTPTTVIDRSLGSRACGGNDALLVIDEVSYGTNGRLRSLSMRWEIACTVTGRDVGGVAFNESTATWDREIYPKSAPASGATTTFSMVNHGVRPTTVDAVVVTGPNAGDFRIDADSCTGATLQQAERCDVDVVFVPLAPGERHGRLTFFDSATPTGGTGEDVVFTGTTVSPLAITYLHVTSEDDDALGEGQQGAFHAYWNSPATPAATFIASGGLRESGWSFQFQPPSGQAFGTSPRSYPVTKLSTPNDKAVGMRISRDGRTCEPTSGQFMLDEFTWVTPDLFTLSARWELHCPGSTGTLFGGAARFTGSPTSILRTPGTVTWDQVPAFANDVRFVALTNDGPAAATIGALGVRGGSGDFSIVDDQCSYQSLPVGDSCEVGVAFRPGATPSATSARLVIPHQGALADVGGTGQDVILLGSSVPQATSNFGEFVGLKPARIMSTRTGVGVRLGPISANGKVELQVAGRGGVPASNVLAVVVNVTTSSSAAAGAVVVWPSGSPRPNSISMAASSHADTKLTIVRVGRLGRISVGNRKGLTHVSIDVVGYFTSAEATTGGARYHPQDPARLGSTTGGGLRRGGIAAGKVLRVGLRGKAGIPTVAPYAVMLNVTAYNSTAPAGTLTVYPEGSLRPAVGQVTFGSKGSFSNVVIVRLAPNGIIDVHNSAGTTQVAIDVLGYFAGTSGDAGRYVPVTQNRIWDTRSLHTPHGPGHTLVYPIAGHGGIAHDASAAMLTITAVSPTSSGFLRIFPDDLCRMPANSDLRFVAQRSGSIGTVATLSSSGPCLDFSGEVAVFNSAGTTNVLVDVVGYFTH